MFTWRKWWLLFAVLWGVVAALLLEESERRAARERAEQHAKRAHDELEKPRRLALPR